MTRVQASTITSWASPSGKKCDLPPSLPKHLATKITIGLLRIASKRRDGAELNTCLNEAYDVFANVLMDHAQPLTDEMMTETIPSWVLYWANVQRWLLPLPEHKSRVALGDLTLSDSSKKDILSRLAGRLAYWQAEALEHAASQASGPGQTVAPNLESVAPGSDSARPTRPKHGPPPNPHSWAVAEVVQAFSPNWKNQLDDICEKLDELKIPISPEWAKWPKKPHSWARAAEYGKSKVEKVIEQRLDMAETYSPPALPNPRNSRNSR